MLAIPAVTPLAVSFFLAGAAEKSASMPSSLVFLHVVRWWIHFLRLSAEPKLLQKCTDIVVVRVLIFCHVLYLLGWTVCLELIRISQYRSQRQTHNQLCGKTRG